jgi:hypothetical protein
MSELVSQGENDLLVFFQEYLNRRPEGADSPVTIKAKDLDKNYKLATVINEPDKSEKDRSYTVEYTNEGTVLQIEKLPDGQTVGDLLYWNGLAWTLLGLAPENQGDLLYWDAEEDKWMVLPAVDDATLHILGIKDGVLQWVETQDCPE